MKKIVVIMLAIILVFVPVFGYAASIEEGDDWSGGFCVPDCEIDVYHRSTAGHDIHSADHVKGCDGQWLDAKDCIRTIATFTYSHAEPSKIQFEKGRRPMVILYYEKVEVPVHEEHEDDKDVVQFEHPDRTDVILEEHEGQVELNVEKDYVNERDLTKEMETEAWSDNPLDEYVDQDHHIKIAMGDQEIVIRKDGVDQFIIMDVEPYIKNDRVMMPLRFIGEVLGYEVTWDQETQTASLKSEDKKVEVTWGNDYALVNDETIYPLDVPLEMVNDRIMMPVGQLARILGLVENEDFYWDNQAKALYFMPKNE